MLRRTRFAITAATWNSSGSFSLRPANRLCRLNKVDHRIIREFIGLLYERRLQKSSVARKLAAMRSFFKFCMREGYVTQNPARLVSTPKIPKRVPRVLSAEELNGFLDRLASGELSRKGAASHAASTPKSVAGAALILKRDRAILELLYASGLRVSELVGLDLGDVDRRGQMVRVLGKGRKERVVPYGAKAEEAFEAYWPVRSEILSQPSGKPAHEAVFLNHCGGRLTDRFVHMIVKKYSLLNNSTGTCIRTRCGTPLPRICWPMARTCARFRSFSATSRFPPRSATRRRPSSN